MYLQLTEEMRKGALALFERTPTAIQLKRAEPFLRNGIIGRAYRLCCEGTTFEKLQELVESHDGDYAHVLRKLRRCYGNGKRWVWKEKNDRIKIDPVV
jgi:hypothetical protein